MILINGTKNPGFFNLQSQNSPLIKHNSQNQKSSQFPQPPITDTTSTVTLQKSIGQAEQNNSNPIYDLKMIKNELSYATNAQSISGRGYTGGSDDPQAVITFSIDVPTTGDYDVKLRYANGSGTTQSVKIYVNDAYIQQVDLPTLANWDQWENQLNTLSLNEGSNTISYKTGSNINLDYITIQPLNSSTTEPTQYEAEEELLSGSARIFIKDDYAPGVLSIQNKFVEESKPKHSVQIEIFPQIDPNISSINIITSRLAAKTIAANSQDTDLIKSINNLSLNSTLTQIQSNTLNTDKSDDLDYNDNPLTIDTAKDNPYSISSTNSNQTEQSEKNFSLSNRGNIEASKYQIYNHNKENNTNNQKRTSIGDNFNQLA